jgi:hypothetical protein
VSTRKKALVDEVTVFVRYHLERGCFGPLTGQDWPAWRGFVYLLQCYSHGGGQDALAAMAATVRCAQSTENVLRVFVQAIPAVMDWGDVAKIWPFIAHDIRLRGEKGDAREIVALEKTEGYPTRLHGWRPHPAQTNLGEGNTHVR